MWTKESYIGVTGFTDKSEVHQALDAVPHYPSRLLMVGVLASWKSLRGEPLNPMRQPRFPKPEQLATIFPTRSNRTLNLVHYSTADPSLDSLMADMFRIHDLVGPALGGFQLNVAWPELRQIDDYRLTPVGERTRLVLQINSRAIEEVGNTPRGVANYLYHYIGVIDDILLDQSGGLGRYLDPNQVRPFLEEIASRGWDIGLGTAGGLGPASLELAQPLIEKFPDLNIDAEGNLMGLNNQLDPSLVRQYLKKAFALPELA